MLGYMAKFGGWKGKGEMFYLCNNIQKLNKQNSPFKSLIQKVNDD